QESPGGCPRHAALAARSAAALAGAPSLVHGMGARLRAALALVPVAPAFAHGGSQLRCAGHTRGRPRLPSSSGMAMGGVWSAAGARTARVFGTARRGAEAAHPRRLTRRRSVVRRPAGGGARRG